jgi:hypothetical protein
MSSCPVHNFLAGQIEAQRILGPAPRKGFRYASLAEYVFDNSTCSKGRPFTFIEASFVALCKQRAFNYWGEPQMKACYANAQQLITADGNDVLKYVEGFASHAGSILPVLHAWVELRGAIIDTTPVWKDTLAGVQPTSCYHGAFRATRRQVLDHMVEGEMFSSFIDDWTNGFPLLREAS